MVYKHVSVTPNGYMPQTTYCQVGDVVRFTNTDTAPHGVDWLNPVPTGAEPTGCGDLAAGAIYDVTMYQAGVFNYADDKGPGFGTVVVSAPSM